MKEPRKIGILGGMGPEATVLLQQKLMAAVAADDDADHIPLLIDMNPQVPSRIAHLIEGTGRNPGPTLAQMSQRLQAGGAEALAMPCNTAHHYASYVTSAVDIPFLDMVDLSVKRAAETNDPGTQIGMLASPAVRRTQLFEKALEACGLSTLWPEDDDTPLAAIRSIKKHGPTEDACDTLRAISADLAARGATTQFVACSEFSLIADCLAPGVQVIDTVDVLTDAIVAFQQPRPEGS